MAIVTISNLWDGGLGKGLLPSPADTPAPAVHFQHFRCRQFLLQKFCRLGERKSQRKKPKKKNSQKVLRQGFRSFTQWAPARLG
jgi:hypothetical protein